LDSFKGRSFELRFLVAVTLPKQLLEKVELDHTQKPLTVTRLRVSGMAEIERYLRTFSE